LRRLKQHLLIGLTATGVALVCLAPSSSSSPRKGISPAPLEFKISGPAFIREGQKLKFKAVLINRSSGPIVLAPPNSRLGSSGSWKITDAAGRENRPVGFWACPVTGIDPKAKIHLEDDDVRILMPGEKLEFEEEDISYWYVFPGRGRYQVTASYVFTPPDLQVDAGTLSDGRRHYDVTSLSTLKAEALKHAVAIDITSNTWPMRLD
jgi:hypothetical protein